MLRHKVLAAEIGKITSFGYESSNPEFYLPCDGSVVSRLEYQSLFAKIGTSFGAGDGTTTFHLPDMRGRFLRGADKDSGRDPDRATRSASNPGGATGDNIGSTQEDHIKAHTHVYYSPLTNSIGDNTTGRETLQTHNTTPQTTISGGNESRHKNVSVIFYIRHAR